MEQPNPVEEPQEPQTEDPDTADAPQEGDEQGEEAPSESVPTGDIESPAEPGAEAPTG